jgi:hypothetical protein
MTPSWVSAIALLGWLVLTLSALRARQLNARKAVVYGLVWCAIFLAVAALFGAMG